MNPGFPLERDPALVLPAITVQPTLNSGPVRSQQFVIELVGPRTAPADAVKAVFRPEWQSVLSTPEVYVMAPSNSQWRLLTASDGSAAYDSIALAWDLISARGALSAQSTQSLWNASEDLARQLSRRALAMPIPADVGRAVAVLKEVKDSLDIGVNLSVVPTLSVFSEQDIWMAAAAMGLDCSPQGVFQYRALGSDLPLFEVFSLVEGVSFSLSQASSGATHDGIGLGFSVPLCPEPMAALDGCLRAANGFASRLRGQILDEEDRPLSDATASEMRSDLGQAIGVLTQNDLAPGSREAVKLFGV